MKNNYSCGKMMLLLAVVLSFSEAWAQNSVTGTVTSKADKSALPGIAVTVKGTTSGTATDPDGKYTLSNVPANATLVYSFIGFATQEVQVGTRTVIDVQMSEDIQKLSEVVVTGYGTSKKKDLTGAVTQVTSKDFNSGINPNPLQAIQGKVAGLVITQPSGDPNQAPTVRLRGYTSLAGGSDPLYVVDGVIGVPINSISPADIATMDVLKDASAAAIYGSRAANGVIMITTKRGQNGAKPTVTFNNYIGMENISNQLDMLDANGYRSEVSRIKGAASLNDGLRFPKDASGNGYSTDWMKQITRTGMTYDSYLALSGGGTGFNYRGSVDYIKREGIIQNTGFERLTTRINIDQKAINNRLNVQYNLSMTNTSSKLTNGDVIARATTFLPTLPIRDPATGGYYEVGGSFDLFNPVAMLENYKNDETKRVFIGGINAKYEIIDGLTLGVNGAYKNENTINSQAYNSTVKFYSNNQGRTSKNLYQTNNSLLELTATYAKEFGNNSNFNILGGYSYQDNIDDGFGGFNNNYIAGSYELIGYNNLGRGRGTLLSGRSDYVSSYKNEYKLISFFGRATVNLNDKYNITGTVRRDGSSKFGANNKWGVFPSIAAGWIISNEDFLRGGQTLSYLKLRAGWGQTGNSEGISPYQSLLLYGPQNNYYDGSLNNFVPGYGVIQNTNPNLKWEVLEQTNIGLDFSLFNRITGTLDVYQKDTKDMLYNFTVPTGSQYFVNYIVANVGKMRNQGIELSLGADVIQNTNFTWNARLVGSAYKNEIVNLHSDDFNVGVIRYNPFGGRGLSDVYASVLREGHPLGEFLIPHFTGFAADGKVQMQAEGGGNTTDYTKATKFESGTAQPRLTVAFINSFRYKHFDLNFQLRGVFGNKIMNNLRSNLAIPGSILETNMLKAVFDYPANYSINQLSDLWLESGSFVRLDNWQIGYNFPTGSKILQSARIYVGGNNLFIITNYKGIDPELEVKGDLQTDPANRQKPNNMGMDNSGIYPKTRSFQLGVNLHF